MAEPKITYTFYRFGFLADKIEPLNPSDSFRIDCPQGSFQMTKAEFYRDFNNVVKTQSYRINGVYHSSVPPKKAMKYRIPSIAPETRIAISEPATIKPCVKVDLADVVNGLRKAAEEGCSRSQYLLGFSYANGQGVERNLAEAVKWYLRAAEQGEVQAQLNLAFCYYDGEGFAKNLTEAIKWFREAAKRAQAAALFIIGYRYHDNIPEADLVKAVELYRKATEQGDAQAQFDMAVYYEVKRNDCAEAVKWYREAAEQGHVEAQNLLGYFYASGEGVIIDRVESHKWYLIAAANGSKEAAEAIQEAADSMSLEDVEAATQAANSFVVTPSS